jgi:hypothetical protein
MACLHRHDRGGPRQNLAADIAALAVVRTHGQVLDVGRGGDEGVRLTGPVSEVEVRLAARLSA